MKFIYLTCLIMASATLGAQLKVAGSDLLESVVGVPLAVFAEDAGVEISVRMEGSLPGRERFREGEVDLLILAEPGGEFEAPPGVVARPLAFLVAVVATHRESPLDEISLRQLQRIFAAGRSDPANRWSDLDVPGLRTSGNLRPVIFDSPQSLLGELFRATALNRAEMRGEVQQQGSAPQIVELLTADPNTVGILPFAPESRDVKVLRVAGEGEGDFAFDPQAENVYYGSYPLRLPFYVVFREADAERLKEVLQLLYSEDFADVLRESGYLPLPQNLRQRLVMELTATR
jgi:ABC-type phosphate transport system substrate-binding protein